MIHWLRECLGANHETLYGCSRFSGISHPAYNNQVFSGHFKPGLRLVACHKPGGTRPKQGIGLCRQVTILYILSFRRAQLSAWGGYPHTHGNQHVDRSTTDRYLHNHDHTGAYGNHYEYPYGYSK